MRDQSGLQVEMKWDLGTAESVFTTRLMQTFQVRLNQNIMKILAVFFVDNLTAVRMMFDGKTRLNSVIETKIRNIARTIAMRIFVEKVSPLYGNEMVGSSQLKYPGA